MNRLEGKVAVVTGANSGVGAAIAKLFAAEGAKVVMSARRVAALEEVSAEIEAAGGETLVVPTDISKPEDPENLMAAAVEKFGQDRYPHQQRRRAREGPQAHRPLHRRGPRLDRRDQPEGHHALHAYPPQAHGRPASAW